MFNYLKDLCNQMSKILKWSESYVIFGFTKVIRNDRAQCLHCSVVMSKALLQSSKLKNHCDKKHFKGRMMTSTLCLPKEYDTTWQRRDLIWNLRQRKSLLFNTATRWHIELRSVRSRMLSLRNLSSHAQKQWLK